MTWMWGQASGKRGRPFHPEIACSRRTERNGAGRALPLPAPLLGRIFPSKKLKNAFLPVGGDFSLRKTEKPDKDLVRMLPQQGRGSADG